MSATDLSTGVACQFAGHSFPTIRRYLFGIRPAEATFARRGFAVATPDKQQHLEAAGCAFIAGYNAAVLAADPPSIAAALAGVPGNLTGFAFEGAGMGFALLDLITPWRGDRFARYIAADGSPHRYMAHVGAGWALARTSRRLAWRLGLHDPLLKWLALDGYGFHAGYFHPRAAIQGRRIPTGLRGVACNVFDQGLGRSLWFAYGADPAAVIATIEGFPASRQPDLWSGIGLAAAYAGAAEESELVALVAAAGSHHTQLGQGAAFAAKARTRAGNAAAHTELACRIFCRADATTAAAWTDEALPTPSSGDQGQAYQQWRGGIRNLIVAHLAQSRP